MDSISSIFIGIIQNIAIMLSLCTVYAFLHPYLRSGGLKKECITGMLFGVFCVICMMMPFRYAPGIFFDSRSIIISLTGFFFGAVPILMTATMASVYRLFVGGPGTTMGVLVIVESALIGLLFYRLRVKRPWLTRPIYLYLFGVLVHGVMVALMVTLPPPHRLITFKTFVLPVLALYPLGTLFIGYVFVQILRMAELQDSLKKSEMFYRHLVQQAKSIILRWKTDGTITFANDFALNFFGFTADELIGKNVIGTIVPRKESTGRDLVAMIADIGKNPEAYIANENENTCKDGRRVWISWSNHGLRNASGEVTEILSVGNDITEKRRSEERLHMLATTVENASDHIVITDAQGAIQYINKATCTASGVPAEEVLGKNFFFPSVETSTPKTLLKEIWTTVSSGNVWSGQLLNRSRTGMDMLLEAVITPIKDQSGQIINYVSVSRNRTREHELEQQLRNAQKLEAIGTLAGGIAHDFNNILAGMIGYVEVTKEALPEESPVQNYLNRVLDLGDRAANLIKQILTFSRAAVGERKVIALNSIIHEALSLLRPVTPSSIQIVLDIPEQPCTVFADPTQMLQLIMNLCTNAVHAMENCTTGVLTITLNTVELSEKDAKTSPDIIPGTYVSLCISDTGTGISPDIMNKIFDPFFTTKKVGKGTGLGLSVVHGIVKEHGGTIRVESTLGKGSSFFVLFPFAQQGQEKSINTEAVSVTIPKSKGKGRILFVDDEESLADTYRQMLERLGHTVTTACNGKEAWQLFSQQPDMFDIVITDQTMPEMNGIELAKKIRLTRADIPIVLCTGYTDWVTPDYSERAGITVLLEKPVPVSTMELQVQKLLHKLLNS